MATTKKAETNGRADEVGPVSNGAAPDIDLSIPYTARVTIRGVADLLFHAWNNEAVRDKAGASKGSKAKKTDNVESYVRRDDDGLICMPGAYLAGSVYNAAKFRQDPRSPRKSAHDLFKAAVITMTPLAPIHTAAGGTTKVWDFEDRRRVTVQRAGVTRTRPAFKAGWSVTMDFLVTLPGYIEPATLHDTLIDAGRLVGVADFRPTYGRFLVTSFEVLG